MLSSLKFNPVKGTIHLGSSRLVMQRAAVGVALRKELLRLLGPEETRLFLMRLGFRSGREDAVFVRESWPNLDTGDAFTAGTRLHMFSGVVRVETVHNDFDFTRGRFSGEFRWHDSVEADDARDLGMTNDRPACWTQVGYAAGYASEFFRTLIVYKETRCIAQGHDACTVIGKSVDLWPADDPEVRLFRERVAVDGPLPEAMRPKIARHGPEIHGTDPVLAPCGDAIRDLAATGLPVLVCGPLGTGRHRALAHLARLRGLTGGVQVLEAADLTADGLVAALGGPGRKASATMVAIVGIERLGAAADAAVRNCLTDASLAPRIAATSELGLGALSRASGLSDDLWLRLRPCAIEMPCFAARPPANRRAIAEAALVTQARRLNRRIPDLDDEALAWIGAHPWPGNMAEMEAVLTQAMLARPGAERLGAAPLADAASRLVRRKAAADIGPHVQAWIATRLSEGNLPLSAFEDEICRLAVDRSGGNLSAAARALGLSRAQLAYRLDKRDPVAKDGG